MLPVVMGFELVNSKKGDRGSQSVADTSLIQMAQRCLLKNIDVNNICFLSNIHLPPYDEVEKTLINVHKDASRSSVV